MKIVSTKNESGFSLVELTVVSVILTVVIGITATIVQSVQSSYSRQRPRTEALNEATAALDMLTRLVRMAGNNPNNISSLQAIDAGTPVSGIYKTIRIRGDWHGNPAGVDTPNSNPDGDTNDSFENVLFYVNNNQLMKRELADVAGVAFLDDVNDMSFSYYDTNNALVTNPVTSAGLISRIDISIVMQTPNTPPMTFTSSAFLRQK